MSITTITNLLLVFSFVAYFLHAYFHNTVDFLWYWNFLAMPVKNWPLKYAYANSFFLFMISVALFVTSTAINALQVESTPIRRALLALSVVLALGALRLVTLPKIQAWPKRAQ